MDLYNYEAIARLPFLQPTDWQAAPLHAEILQRSGIAGKRAGVLRQYTYRRCVHRYSTGVVTNG